VLSAGLSVLDNVLVREDVDCGLMSSAGWMAYGIFWLLRYLLTYTLSFKLMLLCRLLQDTVKVTVTTAGREDRQHN
jgi:hypothetical protein